MLFGRRASTTTGTTWGYYGGKYRKADGTILTIANTTLALTASSTNYILETDGVVSNVTTAPTGWPGPLASNAKALYAVICSSSAVTGYTDYRTPSSGPTGATGATGPTGPAGPSGAAPLTTKGDLLGYNTASTRVPIGTDGQVLTADSAQALGLKWATPTTGTVTSVAMTVPAEFSVTGSPITGAGTLAVTKATQSANLVYAGPSSGAAAAPTFRTLVAADLPTQPFDVVAFYPGIPTASAKIYRAKFARAVTFAANFSGSQFAASANATASTVFDIQKNGVSTGSCTIAAAGTTPTFASTGGAAVSFAAGDLLTILAPATADATLADPAFTLAGTR